MPKMMLDIKSDKTMLVLFLNFVWNGINKAVNKNILKKISSGIALVIAEKEISKIINFNGSMSDKGWNEYTEKYKIKIITGRKIIR